MQNTSAVKAESSEKGEDRGKSPEFSEASMFWFPVYEGLFEHAQTIRDAVWFFMWLIARTTVERDGEGRVLGGIPIDDGRPAREIGVSVKVIRRWRRILLKGGYILTVRTGYGFIYTLLKSKKYQYRDRPNRPISLKNQTGKQDREVPERADQIGSVGQIRSAGAGSSNKKIQGQQKDFEEAEAPETGATPTTNQSSPVLKDCWKVLGLTMPIGGAVFQGEWEAFYDNNDAGQDMVDLMEEFIQYKLERGQRGIPPGFYSLKHELERAGKEVAKASEPRTFDQIRREETDNAMRNILALATGQDPKALPATSGQVMMAPLPAETPALPARAEQTKRESKEMTPERQALAERKILATVLRDNDALGKHPQIKNLEAGHFTADVRHKTIFDGMRNMRRFGKSITADSLIASLQDRGEMVLQRAGGEGYIRSLVDEPGKVAATA